MEKLVLSTVQVEELVASLSKELAAGRCDHTLRLTRGWAMARGVDWPDLLDALEESGAYCDCEVVLNLPEIRELAIAVDGKEAPTDNPWCIPDAFVQGDPDHQFTRVLLSVNRETANCYSPDGDILVPAPRGAKARKRVRRSVHFFVGLSKGLPNEVGFVKEFAPTTAGQFAKQARQSGLRELARFTGREAAFYLSRLESLPVDTAVGAHFMDVTGISSKKGDQLRIHKVMLRRK